MLRCRLYFPALSLPFLCKTPAMADWSQLPSDLLILTAKRLETRFDIIRFRSVCSAWRSSASPKPRSPSFRFAFVSEPDCRFECQVSIRTIFLIKSPETQDCWLVKVEEDAHDRLHLLDSISDGEHKLKNSRQVLDLSSFGVIELAQEYVFRDPSGFCTYEAAYSSSAINDFALLVVSYTQMAMYKSKDGDWTVFESLRSPCDDVIKFNGNFYVVEKGGGIIIVKPCSKTMSLVEAQSRFSRGGKRLLVDSGGDLLLVDMSLPHKTNSGSSRLVADSESSKAMLCLNLFRLDEEGQKWDEVESLDDRVLFLGKRSNFSVSMSEIPGIKGNRVVFSDAIFSPSEKADAALEPSETYVFNLRDGSLKALKDCPDLSKLFSLPPDWDFRMDKNV